MKQNFPQKIHFSFLAMALILSFNLFTSAQDITGTLVGTVRDSSGAAVAGATVTIVDPTKDNVVVRTITTTDEGVFSAPNLQSGIYQISVEAVNFKKAVQTDVKLDVGARRNVDIELAAGNISETVTIEADAVAVNLSTPTAASVISGDQVRELAVNNRNFVQLITLSPGVSSNLSDQVFVGTTNPDGQANAVSISINGSRSSQNKYTVDGADITDRGSNLTIQAYPSLDSIGEFRVLRSLYPAESGGSGGGQVNLITRSGTDKFHGSLFEFVRNEKFNANNYLTNRNAPLGVDKNGRARRSPFRYNNFGGTIGGPIYFLNFGERNSSDDFIAKVPRSYFFFSEEVRRDVRFPTLNSSVPDANLRNGIFPVDICLSGTRATTGAGTCPDGSILRAGTPLTNINPVAQSYLNIYKQLPLPNLPNYQLSFPARNISNFRQEILKLDTSFTQKLSAFYRYERDAIPTIEANSLFSSGGSLPGVSTTQTDSPGRTHTAQATYVASPNFIVEGRYTHVFGAILSSNIGLLAKNNTNVPVNLAYPNQRDRIPTVTGTGFGAFTGFGPYNNFSTKDDVGGNITYILGNHTTKFGGSMSKYRKNENALAGNNEGAFTGFLNTTAASPTQGTVCAPNEQIKAGETGVVGACRAGTTTTLQTFANFLLGNNASFTQAKADYTADVRQRNFEGYGQDEWRARKNLTIYYGVRYSFFGSPYDNNGLLTNFVPELYNSANAPLVTGAGNRVVAAGSNFCNGLIVNSQNFQTAPNNCTPTISPYGKYVVKADKKNFAPRVGLAFDPFGTGKTSIRTGYGIFHEQVLVGIFEQNLISNPPYQETTSLSGINLSQTFATNPVATLAPISVRGEDTDWKTPYMQHWSLDVQHQITKNTVIDIGYYGSKGTHLVGIVDLNLLEPGVALKTLCATGASTAPTVACQAQNTAFTTAAQENILDQIRPFRGYRAVNIIKPQFNSNYHSLQVSAEHRFSGASQVSMAYTFAKNLTDNQTDRSTAPQNPYNIRAEYGRAQLDRRHVFVANYVYELPFFRKSKGLAGLLLGGFQSSGIFNYQTGLPLTATIANYDPSGIGFLGASASGARPNIIGNPNGNVPNTFAQFFNIAAYQTSFPASGISNTTGSAGRGEIFGPRTVRFDMTLSKNFHFNESMRLQLRAEAFNIFNTTNFTTINTVASTSLTATTLFGQVTGTRDPRTMQFGAKFYF